MPTSRFISIVAGQTHRHLRCQHCGMHNVLNLPQPPGIYWECGECTMANRHNRVHSVCFKPHDGLAAVFCG
jgi:phage terminase large subunit-like protein